MKFIRKGLTVEIKGNKITFTAASGARVTFTLKR